MKKTNLHDSWDEVYMEEWLKEATLHGLVKKWERSKTIPYFQGLKVHKKNLKKNKSLIKKLNITPDYNIMFHDKAYKCNLAAPIIANEKSKYKLHAPHLKAFFYTYDYVSTIDVKASVNAHKLRRTSHASFVYRQALLWSTYNKYLQKVRLDKLFDATFTPKKCIVRFSKSKIKRMKLKVRTIEEYLNQEHHE